MKNLLFLNIKCAMWQLITFGSLFTITVGYYSLHFSRNNKYNSYTAKNFTIPIKIDEIKKVDTFLEPKILKLENLVNDGESLRSDAFRKIFFIETHMDEIRTLENPRQACSVESAAKANPDAKVYFILLTNTTSVSLKYSEIAKVLLSYDNIHIKFLNPYEFSKGTTIQHLIESNIILNSKFSIEHMSDAMRFLLLSKYPGQYMDLDVLSLASASKIEYPNFACTQENNLVANAVIKIDKKGHKVMDVNLQKLNTSYNPNSWAGNGPNMFSDSVRIFCKGTPIVVDKYITCDDFTIMPTKRCYPFAYSEFAKFYKEDESEKAMKIIQESGSYFVHIWNKMQEFGHQHFKLNYNSSSAYVKLAKDVCPHVMKSLDKYF